MDTQLLVAVNVMALSAMITVALLARRDWSYAWSIAVHLVILLAGGAAMALGWTHAGTLVGSLFAGLVLLPGALVFASQRKAAHGDIAASVRYAAWAARVHPTPIQRLSARIIAAQAIGNSDESAAAFRAIAADAPARFRSVAEIAAARACDRWETVLEIIASAPTATTNRIMKIRALGETGRIEEMIAAYNSQRTDLPADERAMAELFVLAFAGRAATIAKHLAGKRGAFDPETRSYWSAIAEHYSGNSGVGALPALAASSQRGATRLAATRHAERGPLAVYELLTPSARAVVDTLESRTLRALELSTTPRSQLRATLGLMAANALMFGAELVQGGPERLETLYALGGLWPSAVADQGEWWRVATALFLHFGWAHFLVNMASLYALGRVVEVRYGTPRMMLIYLLGGLASSAYVLLAMRAGWIEEALLVGASGAVMALFGAMLAYQLLGWRKSRDALDRGPVAALVMIILLQTAIDLSLPNVSLAAHLSGVVCGFVIAAAILIAWPRPERLSR